MFSIVTVASSTRMPTASAKPPSVMILSVSPIADSMMIAPSTDSGIEMAMMTVERQLPRNSRIITLVRSAAMTPSTATPSIAPRTNTDWSPMKPILSASGSWSLTSITFCLMPAMISSVEVAPAFSTIIRTAVAVDVNDVGLRRIAVPDGGDVADIDHRAVDRLDWQVAKLFHLERRVVELDVVFELADLLGAYGGNQILRCQRVGDVLPGQAARLQRGWDEVDLDLALLAAERIGNGGARHGDERGSHLVDADISQVLLGQPLARQRHLNDWNGGGAVVEDERRSSPGRHLLQQRLRNRRHLGVGGTDVDVRLEEDLDDADAVIGIGDDMLDIVDGRRQRPLKRQDDASGHLVRRQAGIIPDHPDDGNPDVREDVGWRAQCSQRPDDQQQQGEHDKRIRPAQCNTDQRDHVSGIPRGPRSGMGTGAAKSPVDCADLAETQPKGQFRQRSRPSLPRHSSAQAGLAQAARTESRNLPTSSLRRLESDDSDCAAESTGDEAEPVSLAPR